MSRLPPNTQVQKFLEETYDKERDARLGWFMQRSRKGGSSATGSKQFEVFKKKIEANAPHVNEKLLELRTLKPKSFHRKISNEDDILRKRLECADASLDLTDMLPVTGPPKDVLYDGFTKEGKGRYTYLSNRHKVIPELKYKFPVLSSWDYGWRLEDVVKKKDVKKPPFGRNRIVQDTFYTRTGIPGLQRSETFYL